MTAEKDEAGWLPETPPPRPSRREASIELALRKFDGEPADAEKAPREQQPSGHWARNRRPQLAIAASAALVLLIGIPAGLNGLKNQEQVAPPPSRMTFQNTNRAAPPPESAPRAVAEVSPAPPTPPARKYRGDEFAPVADRSAVKTESPAQLEAPPLAAPLVSKVAAAPPPPPAPPPPTMATSESPAQVMTDSIAVTGSRIRAPSAERDYEPEAAAERIYADFLSDLQGAVRGGDRRALIGMVGFPLRVNSAGGARAYRDARSVERDFDRIFTSRVRRAILRQKGDRLFVRDQGVMIGNGEVWFSQTCPNAGCSSPGPVRIVAVNP